MKINLIFFLFLSYVYSQNNKKHFVYSNLVKDTTIVKLTLRNKTGDIFEKSDNLVLTFKESKMKTFTKSTKLKIDDIDNIKDRKIKNIYNSIKKYLDDYQLQFYDENVERIKDLYKKEVLYYFYRVEIILIPQAPPSLP